MLQEKIIEAVIELGLTKFEAGIYILLLDQKTPTITELVTRTGTYRRKVYEALQRLNEMGLIEHQADYSREIVVMSPVVLDTLLKSRQYELNKVSLNYQDILPQLMTNYFSEGKVPQIQVFDGLNKFQYLFNTILDQTKDNTEMLSYNEGQDLYDILDLNYFLSVWVAKRVAKKVFARVLANGDNPAAKKEKLNDKIKYREIRILNNNRQNQGCYWVVGTKVILWDTAAIKAITIESHLLANMFTEIFDNQWTTAKVDNSE